MNDRLALGTVQFGLEYGVANQAGRVQLEDVRHILQEAAAQGVDTLDTAIAYGDSESTLGQAGAAGWRVVTKLPALPEGCADVAGGAAGCVCHRPVSGRDANPRTHAVLCAQAHRHAAGAGHSGQLDGRAAGRMIVRHTVRPALLSARIRAHECCSV